MQTIVALLKNGDQTGSSRKYLIDCCRDRLSEIRDRSVVLVPGEGGGVYVRAAEARSVAFLSQALGRLQSGDDVGALASAEAAFYEISPWLT